MPSESLPSSLKPGEIVLSAICECGHPLVDHADSGWGPHTVCVERLPDENDGWYGTCPCVRVEALDD